LVLLLALKLLAFAPSVSGKAPSLIFPIEGVSKDGEIVF
jgi:hypothetical protein